MPDLQHPQATECFVALAKNIIRYMRTTNTKAVSKALLAQSHPDIQAIDRRRLSSAVPELSPAPSSHLAMCINRFPWRIKYRTTVAFFPICQVHSKYVKQMFIPFLTTRQTRHSVEQKKLEKRRGGGGGGGTFLPRI